MTTCDDVILKPKQTVSGGGGDGDGAGGRLSAVIFGLPCQLTLLTVGALNLSEAVTKKKKALK
ncbi:hypothetical protein DOY81_013562, partial [Sarcophaga bullata]